MQSSWKVVLNKVWKDLLSFIGEDDLAQVGPPRSTQVGSCLIVSVKDGDLSTIFHPISIIVVVVCDIMNAMMNVEDPGSQYQVSIFLVIACRVGYGRQVGLCDKCNFFGVFKDIPKNIWPVLFWTILRKITASRKESMVQPYNWQAGAGKPRPRRVERPDYPQVNLPRSSRQCSGCRLCTFYFPRDLCLKQKF